MKKCFVIYNDQSGKSRASRSIEKIYAILEKYGYETTIVYTKYKQHAEDIVYEIDVADLVISAGGDGTFNEVMTGNLRRKKPLLIANLPLGTTNDVAHMYGFKRDLIKNLELLVTGSIQHVDVCTINDKIFTYVAGFGNFMNIAYDTPRGLKKKYGRVGYLMYGLKSVQDKLKFFDVTYKVGEVECTGRYSFIFVTNSVRIAGVGDIYDDVKLNDGKFEIVLCNLTSKRELIKSILQLSIKHIDQIPGCAFYQSHQFSLDIKNVQGTAWCIDGEKYESGENHFVCKVIENVPLLVPSKNAMDLFIRK